MTENNLTKIRKIEPPAIIRKRGWDRLTGGRWNLYRVAEFLRAKKTWQAMDDIGRFVYGGAVGVARRSTNTRKHIPAQRRYMLDNDTPIVTEYGPRGIIMRVKIFDRSEDDDRVRFQNEIEKAKNKKEISERRYDDLVKLFLLK
jgi:hypothetical protein